MKVIEQTGRVLASSVLALAMGALATSAVAGTCEEGDWKACKGKPWVDGDVMDTPLGSKWWPHPIWGEGDEAGSTNWYTKPEVVKRAIAQIKHGKVYRLGQDYHSKMPMFGERKWNLRIPGSPTGGPFGSNSIVWHDEFLATEIGQAGTQFDGLGHVGVQAGAAGDKTEMRFYNGFTVDEFSTAYGLTHLGVEKLHPIVARGVLIDFAALKEWNAGECAGVAEVKAALAKQGMADFEFMDGDAVMFRFGWERHWGEPDKYNAGEPGLCMDAARWVAANNVGVTGGDSWAATDPVPYPGEKACVFCVHNYLQTRHGIVNQENLQLKQLADDGVYVFAYMYSVMPIKGGTGSPGSPIAIH
ncbi:MAG: cyclase family protein [Chromatiales bacterium]|nr:cyclase family protein [Chromatiales bacterium]